MSAAAGSASNIATIVLNGLDVAATLLAPLRRRRRAYFRMADELLRDPGAVDGPDPGAHRGAAQASSTRLPAAAAAAAARRAGRPRPRSPRGTASRRRGAAACLADQAGLDRLGEMQPGGRGARRRRHADLLRQRRDHRHANTWATIEPLLRGRRAGMRAGAGGDVQVKRLKLSGFKSFVEPAELRVEPGLTGVVGPNGCGKSNVLEAIRWVMGESSPKSMRGAGMDDVIFAGTALAPGARLRRGLAAGRARGRATCRGDVALAPVGEVEVTRRIERGAGSAYRVNGRDVRAKDVALLFADAATGAHSPGPGQPGQDQRGDRRQADRAAADARGSGRHCRPPRPPQGRRAEAARRRGQSHPARRNARRHGAARARRCGARRKAAERYRKLSDQIRIAEGAADLRPLARGGRGGRSGAGARPRPPSAAVEQRRRGAARRRRLADRGRRRRSPTSARPPRRRASAPPRSATSSPPCAPSATASRRRIAELAERRRTLAADRAREAALRRGRRRGAGPARARSWPRSPPGSPPPRAARGTIDVRTVELEDEARAAETALGQARAVQAAEQAEARVAEAALDAARQKLARAEAEAARLAEQMAGPRRAKRLLADARGGARAGASRPKPRLEAAGEAIAAAEARAPAGRRRPRRRRERGRLGARRARRARNPKPRR